MSNDQGNTESVTNDNVVDSQAATSHSEVGGSHQGAEAVTEKMVPQSKVNEIVGATKKAAYEKALEDSKKLQNDSSGYEKADSSFSGLTREEAESLFAKKLEEMNQQKVLEQQQLANQQAQLEAIQKIAPKIDEAASKYEDFADATKLDFQDTYKNVLLASSVVDNPGDLLYHLGKNRHKLRGFARDLDQGGNYAADAIEDLKILSESLKNNELAKQKDMPRSPLSQVRPSNVGVDNGKLSRADLRKKWTV